LLILSEFVFFEEERASSVVDALGAVKTARVNNFSPEKYVSSTTDEASSTYPLFSLKQKAIPVIIIPL